MRFLKIMQTKANPISNTQHRLIFLDIESVINTSFACEKEEVENSNYTEETIGKDITECFLKNKGYLDGLVVYDDINGEMAKLFPNSYLLVDTLMGFDNDVYQRAIDLIFE